MKLTKTKLGCIVAIAYVLAVWKLIDLFLLLLRATAHFAAQHFR